MALIIPYPLAPEAPRSERQFADAARRLPPELTVLHHVNWQSMRGGRQGDGEADFIIIDPRRGVIVVEVKGGNIDVANGTWTSTNSEGKHRIKDPFEQATDSKHALLRYLTDRNVDLGSARVIHAVCFPSMAVDVDLGPNANREIILDRRSLGDLRAAVERVYDYWGAPKGATYEHKRIVALLKPTIAVRRKLIDDVEETELRILDLTRDQIRAFQLLSKTRRGAVVGPAGSGKTLLAIERAQKLARDGFKTLLVCYNELLGLHLQAEVRHDQDIAAGTFHSFCMQQIRKAKLLVPSAPDAQWWEKDIAASMVDAAVVNGTIYDAILVDEGQDFSEEWLNALLMLVRDAKDPPFYVFADPRQSLFRAGWSTPEWLGEQFPLESNCRNSDPIARRVAALYGDPFNERLASGHNPVFVDTASDREAVGLVQRIADRLIREEGIAASQLIVLSDDLSKLKELRQRLAGEVPFVQWSGIGVRAETVARAKGLEAEVVLLMLSEKSAAPDATALLYAGISRARSALFVFAPPAVKVRLAWN